MLTIFMAKMIKYETNWCFRKNSLCMYLKTDLSNKHPPGSELQTCIVLNDNMTYSFDLIHRIDSDSPSNWRRNCHSTTLSLGQWQKHPKSNTTPWPHHSLARQSDWIPVSLRRKQSPEWSENIRYTLKHTRRSGNSTLIIVAGCNEAKGVMVSSTA